MRLPCFDCRANDAERGAVAAGGERAGVAVGEHAALVGQQRAAEGSHGLAGGDVFLVHGVGFGEKLLFDFGHRGAGGAQRGKERFHAVDGPEEIDGGGPRAGQALRRSARTPGAKCFCRGGLRVLCAESDAVSRRNADGRRAAHDHGDDDVGHLFVGCGEHVALFERQLRLIDETDAFRGPGECGNHALQV